MEVFIYMPLRTLNFGLLSLTQLETDKEWLSQKVWDYNTTHHLQSKVWTIVSLHEFELIIVLVTVLCPST